MTGQEKGDLLMQVAV